MTRTDDALAVARAVDRVAVLVAAGVPPPRALALVAGLGGGGGGGGDHDTVSSASRSSSSGSLPSWGSSSWGPSSSGSSSSGRSEVDGVLDVAGRTGAPVVPALRALAGALRDRAAAERAVRTALAGPRASARVVLALPWFGVLLGSAWGVDTVGVLTRTPLGWSCVVVASALVAAAVRWSRHLLAAAADTGGTPGLLLEIWAVALSGGGAWSDAARTVAAVHGDRDWPEADRQRLAETLALADQAGVPAAGLLRAAAVDRRADAAAESLVRAERLGVRLVLPLGVCVLPAFVCVGVVPVVLGILSSTSAGLH
ncbi:type II secretion system F family protein [Curtobacterium herbarum]|uniref:type II secretion system F family protein n=1 Tax=Curtobacterium herbarum TaxID=150122 RepID=UPI00195A3B62|nr:type II secretion system F family protein [Curtobacterium herbarum]MBM7474917.1 tight adherence protein B [Curtobacterium herbarum]MCS6545562.1 type II secretion system F family protein [Curtobacterium herbarum]